jgi:hypothetical protein
MVISNIKLSENQKPYLLHKIPSQDKSFKTLNLTCVDMTCNLFVLHMQNANKLSKMMNKLQIFLISLVLF